MQRNNLNYSSLCVLLDLKKWATLSCFENSQSAFGVSRKLINYQDQQIVALIVQLVNTFQFFHFYVFFYIVSYSMEKRRQEKKRLNPFNAKKAFKKLLFIQTNYGLSEFDSNHWRSYACVKNPCLKLNAGVFIKSHSVKKIGLSTSGHYASSTYKVSSIKQQPISVTKKKILSRQNWERNQPNFKRYDVGDYFDHFELFQSIKSCKDEKSYPKRVYQKYDSDKKQGKHKYQIKTQNNQILNECKMNSLESLKRDVLKLEQYSRPTQQRRPLTSQFKNSELKKAIKQKTGHVNRKEENQLEGNNEESSNYEFNPWDVQSFQYSQLEH